MLRPVKIMKRFYASKLHVSYIEIDTFYYAVTVIMYITTNNIRYNLVTTQPSWGLYDCLNLVSIQHGIE